MRPCCSGFTFNNYNNATVNYICTRISFSYLLTFIFCFIKAFKIALN